MPDRLIEIVVPVDSVERLESLLGAANGVRSWSVVSNRWLHLKVLAPMDQVEKVLDALQDTFADSVGFHAVVLPVQASLPKPEEDEKPSDEAKPEPSDRISREELRETLGQSTRLTPVFLATVVLSTVVAAIGIAKGNVAVIIGAMVIAPLLGGNMALALATTLGDARLAIGALKVNAAGVCVALATAGLLGLLVPIEPSSPEVAGRTQLTLGDLLLALAAGSAGALAFTSGVPAALVGVMVAVALLPPLVVFSMLIVRGYFEESIGALLLVVSNLTCVNLAGVVTFLLQGVKPRGWREAEESRRVALTVLFIWVALLIAEAGLILLYRYWKGGIPIHDALMFG